MSRYKIYSAKEFNRLLKNNGYCYDRNNGSHEIWKKTGFNHISVPRSCNPIIFQRLIKENNLQEN